MRSHRVLSVVFALTLCAVLVLPSPTHAADGAGLLQKPTNQLTRADIEQYFSLALNDKITLRESQSFYGRLTAAQKQTLERLIDAEVAKNKARVGTKPPVAPPSGVVRAASGEYWTTGIPVNGGGSGGFGPNFYYQDQFSCDRYPQDTDYDYIYFFSYSGNPYALEWRGGNNLFMTLVGTTKGFGYYDYNTQLCFGDKVFLIPGGADGLQGNLRLVQR